MKSFLLTGAATLAITVALSAPIGAKAEESAEQTVVGRLSVAPPSNQKAPDFLTPAADIAENTVSDAEISTADPTSLDAAFAAAEAMASALSDAQLANLPVTEEIEIADADDAPTVPTLTDTADETNQIVEIFSGDTPVRVNTIILPPVPASKPAANTASQSSLSGEGASTSLTEHVTDTVLASSDTMVQVADISQVAATTATDLPSAIRKAIDNHPLVLGRRAELEASNQAVRVERSDLFPTVSAEGFSGYRNTDNRTTRSRPTRGAGGDSDVSAWASEGTLRLRQLLYDFGTTPNEIDAAKSRLSESQFVEADSQEQIGLRAVEAYLAVQQNSKNARLAEANVQAHIRTLDNVRRRADAGAGDSGDVTQTESRLALAREFLLGFEEATEIASADYKEAVGEMPGTLAPARVPAQPVPDRVADAITIAMAENPFIAAADKAAEGLGHDADAAFGAFYPRFDLDLSYTRGDDVSGIGGKDEESRALVRMVWDIPVAGGEIANRERLLRLREAAEREQEQRVRLVEEAVRASYAEVKRTEQQIEQLRIRAEAADGVVAAYQQQFGAGRRTLLDLLDSENERFLAQVSLNNAENDLISANFQLFSAMGRLRQVLGLPAQLVEPASN